MDMRNASLAYASANFSGQYCETYCGQKAKACLLAGLLAEYALLGMLHIIPGDDVSRCDTVKLLSTGAAPNAGGNCGPSRRGIC
ncbi:cytochrome P450 [Anopheles sinensis]|uniref:Cytochrome P450 n=1 Tax=Anopheles sinensis TaxID=74873 RepID=A0A084VN79_ANOSI|nr:cytochrome P450 [Anopheles sinensis]